MSLTILDENIWFPQLEDALEDGLLAMGGDLSTERLIKAYQEGIFPWFEGETPLWWSPNPRFVIYPANLKVSTTMKQVFKRQEFEFKTNTAFDQVIANCKKIKRSGQYGTWITPAVEKAYNILHQLGIAHSAEAWKGGTLVGGLYGIKMGKLFFGESMFSNQSNASKFAFISYVKQLEAEGIALIDCQVYTEHLESLGAEMIDRDLFKQLLYKYR
jgi:leucyl/phenylalanyl-tRNA--protein transferase